MAAVTALLTVVFIGLVCFACVVRTNPLHAQCAIQWEFGQSCDTVQSTIEAQIKIWNDSKGCDSGGEKCLYTLISSSAGSIVAHHATPKKHYIDDLTFTFTTSGSGCSGKGYSTSEVWYAVLDYGTNYCNLENLITGAGLDKMSGYSEITSDDVCTQYSSKNCDVY